VAGEPAFRVISMAKKRILITGAGFGELAAIGLAQGRDDDPIARAPQGILSLQLEGSGQIWYRYVYLKQQQRSLEFSR
jgi:hypothetical protein